MKLTSICLTTASKDGPSVVVDNNINQQELVALRQGDADGACGAYCLFMALILLGKAKRDEILDINNIDGRTRLGRFMSGLDKESGLLMRDGLDRDQLATLVEKAFNKHIKTETMDARGGARCHEKLASKISNGSPLILGMTVEGGNMEGHWTLLVGYEQYEDNGANIISKFYVIDPSESISSVCPWNAVIHLTAGRQGGRFPYKYHSSSGDDFISMNQVLAIT